MNSTEPQKLPRHEWWRRAYAAKRYMRGLTEKELDLRFADILTNQTILSAQGKIGLSGIEWLEKFTHVHEELSLRGRRFPTPDSLGRRLAIPHAVPSALGEKIRALYPDGMADHFVLFKYGKVEHLQQLLTEGALRLLPASKYKDPSLNVAIADDELRLEKIHGHTRTRYEHRGDYYCFCSTWLHTDRLISDFEATAVLIVDKPHDFFLRLAETVDRREDIIRFNKVTYVDPLLLGDDDVPELPFTKHMRFAYQFEHRWIAQPRGANERLQPIDLRMGNIEDIAKIYTV